MDQKGYDVYFDQYPGKEYDLIQGLQMKIGDPSLTIRTDNWGYFRVAYLRVLEDKSNKWGNYDCFLAICAIAGICGILWIFTGIGCAYALWKESWAYVLKVFL